MSEQETPQAASAEGQSSGAKSSEPGRRDRGRRRHHRHQQQPSSAQPNLDASINMDEVRELVQLIKENGLTEFELQRGDFHIRLSSNRTPDTIAPAGFIPAPASHTATQPVEQQQTSVQPEEELHIIASPIVGTFYRSSSPTAEPFVRIGSHVETDTVVCIIEAMKLMNEIQAEVRGEVAKIYVENGQPVEYGQPLFGIKT
ncbi:MAG TPA: acetyl-CoA carboxylase biotin carboxyl carrier protein [Pyrinomonadaceae bacterium]|nr:acetyl-CoA carboxylase biotin carboxyl carrier protein [Pyrinomonadaceae bacterium]